MSKFIDKFLDSMKLNDEDDYDYEDDYMYDDEEEEDDYEEEKPKKSFFRREKRAVEEEPEMEERNTKTRPRTSNVVPMRTERACSGDQHGGNPHRDSTENY